MVGVHKRDRRRDARAARRRSSTRCRARPRRASYSTSAAGRARSPTRSRAPAPAVGYRVQRPLGRDAARRRRQGPRGRARAERGAAVRCRRVRRGDEPVVVPFLGRAVASACASFTACCAPMECCSSRIGATTFSAARSAGCTCGRRASRRTTGTFYRARGCETCWRRISASPRSRSTRSSCGRSACARAALRWGMMSFSATRAERGAPSTQA